MNFLVYALTRNHTWASWMRRGFTFNRAIVASLSQKIYSCCNIFETPHKLYDSHSLPFPRRRQQLPCMTNAEA